ncbi:MAG TPA: ABC transporter substrate-binding protein [Thermoanaerobaculia bacterium]|nr:ABC transporter substrate-binding protein [Thermoanaerobaculia bacterium]
MSRRFILILTTTLTIGLLLAGCGGHEQVKFGAVIPLTGSAKIYGQSIKKGVELAYEQINANPDKKYPIALDVRDSRSDADIAKAELKKLYDSGAVAVVGGVITQTALAMVPVADRYDRVLLSPSASSPELTGISQYFFRVFPSDFLEGTKMGSFAEQKLGLKTVVILAQKEPYAKGIQGVFKSEFERNGGKVLDVIEFPPNTEDFSGLIGRVQSLKPDGVYLAAYAEAIVQMIKGLREAHYPGVILTTAAFATPEAIAQAGKAAEGVYLTQAVFDPKSKEPIVHDFVTSYEKKYGSEPDLYAAHGFDAMRVLVEALKEADSTQAIDFWKGMRAIRAFPGVTGNIQFDEKGDVQKYPRVYAVFHGKLVDYESEVERKRQELMNQLRKLREERSRTSSPPGS